MDARFLLYIGLGCLAGFVVIVVIFLMHRKKVTGSQSEVLRKMMAKENSNSSSAFYQKMYIKLSKLPAINRYVYKIRRRLELIHNDDEFTIRNDTARIALKNIMVAFLASILLCYINRDDLFMMIVSLIGVLIVVENLTDQGVSKVENKLLVQMLDFLS